MRAPPTVVHPGRCVNARPSVAWRAAGQSKKGTTFRYGFGFLRVILKTWLR